MLKYTSCEVVFAEIPNEISLAINISNCPCKCPGCHSPYLAEDIGTLLTQRRLKDIIEENKGITCVCFMGGDFEPHYINTLAKKTEVEDSFKIVNNTVSSNFTTLNNSINANIQTVTETINANKVDIDDRVSNLQSEVGNNISRLDGEDADLRDYYDRQIEILQNNITMLQDRITSYIRSTGGNNLLRNSVGFRQRLYE